MVTNANQKDPTCFLLGYYIVTQSTKNSNIICTCSLLESNMCVKCDTQICKECMKMDQKNIYMLSDIDNIKLCYQHINKINKEVFEKKQVKEIIESYKLNKIDVIRYCRMWINVLNKELLNTDQ